MILTWLIICYPHAFLKVLPNEIFSNHHQSFPNISQAHQCKQWKGYPCFTTMLDMTSPCHTWIWFRMVFMQIITLVYKISTLWYHLTPSINNPSRKRLAVQFPAMKSPLYLTENLPGGQLPPMLWHWHVGLLSQKKKVSTIHWNHNFRTIIVTCVVSHI